MTIERAVVSGIIASVVQTRNMFTCDVVPSGGDTDQILWDAYLSSVYTPLTNITADIWHTTSYELQNLSGGHWVPFDQVSFVKTGADANQQGPNAVAVVLIAKALGLRHIGRKFFSPITENQMYGNTITTAALAYAASVLLAYITPFTGLGGGTITPGVTDAGGTFHAFVGGVVSSLLGSMRRRKPGLGI